MRETILKSLTLALALTALTAYIARAADLSGSVQVAGKPVTGATVTLYAAGATAPTKLTEAKTDSRGAFKLAASGAPKDGVRYIVAKGGTPEASTNKSANDAIALLAVLGNTPPPKVVVNEFTTVASVWTPEPISTRCSGQGVVIFYGLAKPVCAPQIGPAHGL